MLAHFTPHLLHYLDVTLHPLLPIVAPLPFHVSCLTCDRFYVTSVGLICRQLACFVHKQLSTIGVAMILALSIFLLSFA